MLPRSVVPTVTKDQCLSKSLALAPSFSSCFETCMRVGITKRIKMEGQLKGACHMMSCIKRIIAGRAVYVHLPFASVPSHLSQRFCLEGNSVYAPAQGLKQSIK